MNTRLRLASLNATSALLLATVAVGRAQINQWVGGVSGNWTNAANWLNNGVPAGSGTDTIFTSAGLSTALTLSASTSLRTMYLYGGNYTLTTNAAATFTFQTGGFTQLGAGTFTMNAGMLSLGTLGFNGTGTGAIFLNGTLDNAANTWDKFNESFVTLRAAYTSTSTSGNALRIRAGNLILTSNGTVNISGGGAITIGAAATYQVGQFHNNAGAALVLDNTGINLTDRILSTNQINFSQRGLFEFRGNASAASSETLGILNVSGPGTRIRVDSGAGQSAWVTFSGVQTPNGALTVDVNGNPTLIQFLVPDGDSLGAIGTAGGRVIFTNAPANLNGVLRYGVVVDETGASAPTFATYDSTVDSGAALGVKALAAYTTTDLNAALPTSNVDASGAITLTGSRTNNALRLTPTGAGQTLQLGGNTLTLANANGFIFSGGFDYSITNTSGSGVTASGASYFYVASNTLTIAAPFAKGNEMTKAGDGLLVISGGFSNNSGRQLGVDDGAGLGDDMQIGGAISGGSALNKVGLGTLALTGSGNNSGYSAGISVLAGTLVLAKSSDSLQSNALGSGAFTLAGGTLAATGRAADLANTVLLGNVGSSQSGNQIAGNQAITFRGVVQGNQASGQIYPLINNASANLTLSGTIQGFNGNNAAPVFSMIEFAGSGSTFVTGVIRNTDPTFANAATMSTGIRKAGSGLLVLSGANTYTGITEVVAGYLRLNATNTLGAGYLEIAEGNYAFGQNAVVELGIGNTNFTRALGTSAGQVRLGGNSGNGLNNGGFASVTGTSVVNLGGAGAAVTWGAGSFFQAGGALILGSTNTAGTVEFRNGINLAGNRTIRALDGSNAVDGIVSGVIANGTGSRILTKDGAGTLALTGTNTYSGGTVIAGGTLQVGNGDATGTLGSGSVSNNAALAFNRNNTLTLNNVISGTGTVRQIGSGTTILLSNNTYSGGTLITNGTLQAGNGGTNGTFGTGFIILGNGGSVGFNRSDSVTVGNEISGTGNLLQAGAGTTVLTSNNSYVGATVITAGALQVGNGGLAGSLGNGAVTNNATLVFSRANTLAVSNVISGTGSLIQRGAGETLLAGVSGYTGNTYVSNGTLRVNGNISSSAGLEVLSGATLAGSGKVGSTFIDEGGHLAPGNSPGILTVTNDLTLSNTSQLDFEIGAVTNVRSYYDAVVVQGGLTLDGVLNVSNWAGGFGATSGTNVYALFDYDTLNANNGVELGNVVTNLAYKITAADGQVDLSVKQFNTGASFTNDAVTTTLFLNFGTNSQAIGSNALTFGIFNFDPTDLMLGLELTNVTSAAGPFSLGGGLFSGLLAGSSQTFTTWMDLSSVGVYSNQFVFDLTSTTSGFLLSGLAPGQTLTVILSGEVVAIPEPGSVVALLLVGGSALSRRRRRL